MNLGLDGWLSTSLINSMQRKLSVEYSFSDYRARATPANYREAKPTVNGAIFTLYNSVEQNLELIYKQK